MADEPESQVISFNEYDFEEGDSRFNNNNNNLRKNNL